MNALPKSSKSLWLIAFPLLACVACAPFRAEFTGAKQEKSNTSLKNKLVLPASLKVAATADKLELLKAFLKESEESATRLKEGDYRVMKRTNPVTRKIEQRKQVITSVTESKAHFVTTDAVTGAKTFEGDLVLHEADPFEDGLRAFVEGRNEDVYSLIAGFLSMNYSFDTEYAEKAKVEITLESAAYDPDPTTFKVLLKVAVRGLQRARTLLLEARLVPTLPRPFNVEYIAYGTGKLANQVFLEVLETQPAKPVWTEPLPPTSAPEVTIQSQDVST